MTANASFFDRNLMQRSAAAAAAESAESSSPVPDRESEDENSSFDTPPDTPRRKDGEDTAFGCEHYRRKCQFLTPCCKKLYTCRFCHDDQEAHKLNRKDLTQVKCLKCGTSQEIHQTCSNCGVVFGLYFCSICKLFDDEDKRQYHCDGCGICRIGGRDKFFHCEKCDMCLPVKMQNQHKCVEKVSRANCPVCLEDLHTSRIPSHIPACGHLIHRTCFEELLRTGNYACPLCSASMVDMSMVWTLIDSEISVSPMPSEYANYHIWVLCRDCHKESRILFHVLGLKCGHCGGYNTCRTQTPASESGEDEIIMEESTDVSSQDSTDAVSAVRAESPSNSQSAEESVQERE